MISRRSITGGREGGSECWMLIRQNCWMENESDGWYGSGIDEVFSTMRWVCVHVFVGEYFCVSVFVCVFVHIFLMQIVTLDHFSFLQNLGTGALA